MRAPRGAPSAAPSSGQSEANRNGGGGAAAAAAAGGAEPNWAANSAKTASLAGVPPGPGLGSMPARTSAARVRCDVSYAGAAVRGTAASCAGNSVSAAAAAASKNRVRWLLADSQRGAKRHSAPV
jgi:hypothetical protein